MFRFLLTLLLIAFPFTSLAGEKDGSVCLGKNLSVVWSEQTDRLYITVGDSDKIYFNKPEKSPRIVAENLDKSIKHTVKVYFDDKVVQSWLLDFIKLKTDTVLIWRSKGACRMEAIQKGDCK